MMRLALSLSAILSAACVSDTGPLEVGALDTDRADAGVCDAEPRVLVRLVDRFTLECLSGQTQFVISTGPDQGLASAWVDCGCEGCLIYPPRLTLIGIAGTSEGRKQVAALHEVGDCGYAGDQTLRLWPD